MRHTDRALLRLLVAVSPLAAAPATSGHVAGRVLGANAPIANSVVTLWAASQGPPTELARVRTRNDGRFELDWTAPHPAGEPMYLVASGGTPAADRDAADNPAVVLLAVIGAAPPADVTVNEFTTIAAVWTHNQLLDGTAISGKPLPLRIAAMNVPNLVDVATGGYGRVIVDASNGTKTSTMEQFGTIANAMAGCIARVTPSACPDLFAASAGRSGGVPTTTLAAAHAIARDPSFRPTRLFALFDAFYPMPKGRTARLAPFLPVLDAAPSAWTISLKFTGGSVFGPGKLAIDGDGRIWTGGNFIVVPQIADVQWIGNVSQFAPDGRVLSPAPARIVAAGVGAPGFGAAIAPDGRLWATGAPGKTLTIFDAHGRALSPPLGYDFDWSLGYVQGIIVTPAGDVWALDFGLDKVILLPGGDPAKAKFFCEAPPDKPRKEGPCKLHGPVHLAIDQQDRIWITNGVSDLVTRFPAADPSKVELFPAGGLSGKGIAIDSRGDAWVANTAGKSVPLSLKLHVLWLKLTGNMSKVDRVILDWLTAAPLGSVAMLTPAGAHAPGSPFRAGGIWAPWGIAIDGEDHVWIANLGGRSVAELCGVRTEQCPAGSRPGDPLSPPGGFTGGGVQMPTDVAIDQAGNIWVADNWQDARECFERGWESPATRCGAAGLTVFYGMAAPVLTPQVGPVRAP